MWFYFALAGAVISAGSIVFNKHALRSINTKILAWALFAFPTPFLAIYLLFLPKSTVSPLFWVGVIGSSAFFIVSKLWQLEAIQKGLLSKLIPLSPLVVVFSYILSLIFLGEQVSVTGFVGIGVVMVGTYILNVGVAREGLFRPFIILFRERESLFFILSLFFGAVTILFDKTALTNTTPVNTALTLLVENIITIIPFTFYVIKKEPNWIEQVRKAKLKLVISGIFYTVSVFMFFNSFLTAPIALATAVNQSRVVIIMFLGMLLYQDKPPKNTWISTAIIIFGVIVLKMA